MDINITEYFKKAVYEIESTFKDASDVRLEEYDKDRKEIVVSFLEPRETGGPVALRLNEVLKGVSAERIYKTVEFDADHNVAKVKIYH